MKPKLNEVALPPEVKRGRIDLTSQRQALGFAEPMTSTEKAYIEVRLAEAMREAVSNPTLMKAHELSLKQKLSELKTNRRALSTNEGGAQPPRNDAQDSGQTTS